MKALLDSFVFMAAATVRDWWRILWQCCGCSVVDLSVLFATLQLGGLHTDVVDSDSGTSGVEFTSYRKLAGIAESGVGS